MEKLRASDRAEMDIAIASVRDNKETWSILPLDHRVRLLHAAIRDFGALCDEWVARGLAAKQRIGDTYYTGTEWTAGPLAIIRYLQGLRRALQHLEKNGQPLMPGTISTQPNGQLTTRVFPLRLYERLSTPGVTVDVWMEPGLSMSAFQDNLAVAYRQKQLPGKVALVLGAGNVSGTPVNYTLTKLFVENQVVVLKMNPINEYIGPLIEKAFRQMIDEGFLQVVYGGAAEGAYLCNHPWVDEIHMTGSDRTYEAIVFGVGSEGARRKKEHRPILAKRFTAELGNVAPAIIVPGPWSTSDIRYQAEQIASHLCDNAGYSCSRTRVIVQHSAWPDRHQLMDEIRAVLGKLPSRFAYYPGATEQYQRFLSAHPEAEQFGSRYEGRLPWAIVAGIDPRLQSETCFDTESFCPIIAETGIDASSPADFIDEAVDFANKRLWGTLSATIIVHPRSLEDPAVFSALERALCDLRYGVITVNCIPSLAWAITTPPWGSFPGNSSWDVQSGTGFVHNTFMFARPQKVVVRAPFRTWPRPIWFPSRAAAFALLTKGATRYELAPSWRRLLGIAWAATHGLRNRNLRN